MTDYKVRTFMDDTYEVISWEDSDEKHDGFVESVSHYQGTLADCEAWIRMKESGHLD